MPEKVVANVRRSHMKFLTAENGRVTTSHLANTHNSTTVRVVSKAMALVFHIPLSCDANNCVSDHIPLVCGADHCVSEFEVELVFAPSNQPELKGCPCS